MSNEVQIEKLDNGAEAVTTASTSGTATGTPSAVTTPPPTLEQTITAVAPSLIASVMESIKKVGMPATVAAIVSVLVTVTPFLFKIDERYAKASELQESIDQNKKDLATLTAEVGRVTGAVDVLSQIVGKQFEAIQEMNAAQAAAARELARVERPSRSESSPVRMATLRPIPMAPAPAPAPIVEPIIYEDDVVHSSPGAAEDAQLDSNQDISDSLNTIRRDLDASKRVLNNIQERKE